MGRRRRSALAKFSLFSFQDIITCLMGIMLLLTLLIAMQIVEQPARSSSELSEQRQQLAAAIDTLKQQTAVLREQAKNNRQVLSSGVLASPELLAPKLAEAAVARATAEQELRQLQAAATAETKAAAEAVLLAADKATDSEAEQQRMIAELKRLQVLQNSVLSGNRVVYNQYRGSADSCWIVEFTDDNTIHAARIGHAQKPMSFASIPSVVTWIRNQRQQGAEFLILLKPAATEASELLPEMLRRENIPHGYDLLGQDQTALDPEQGAAAL